MISFNILELLYSKLLLVDVSAVSLCVCMVTLKVD